MAKSQPKKNITKVQLAKNKDYGIARRKSYAKTILEDAPVFPKPLEYEDIDRAMFEFVEKEIEMVANNKLLPTFTLFSNQRFSEYSQSWQHTDEEGNLLMDFKTINRENNPKPGDNQGGYRNIPGNQRYTLLIKDVLEDNGQECYEIYSMKQPYCVDLTYRISIITNIFENINTFNEIINDLFKSIQCYIRPNGHWIPLTLEDIADNSEYSIQDRKFYNQTVTVSAKAYIIRKSDFKVEKKPKNIKLFMQGDTRRPKPTINIEEYYDDKIGYKSIDMTIDFKESETKVEFVIDVDFVVTEIKTSNIRNVRLSVNDVPYYIDKGFEVKNGDNIKIVLKLVDDLAVSQIQFIGYDPSTSYIKDNVPLDVSDDIVKHENISID